MHLHTEYIAKLYLNTVKKKSIFSGLFICHMAGQQGGPTLGGGCICDRCGAVGYSIGSAHVELFRLTLKKI